MSGTAGIAYAVRITTAAAFVATGAATSHLVVLGKAGRLGMSLVILCAFGAALSLWGRLEWNRIGRRLATVRELPKVSEIAAVIFTTWCTVAMICKAIVHVPFGLALLAIAGLIAWKSGGNLLALLLAGWIGWYGGNFVFRPLAGLVSTPKADGGGRATTATHASLRRAGLFGDR